MRERIIEPVRLCCTHRGHSCSLAPASIVLLLSWRFFAHRYHLLVDLDILLSHHPSREIALHMQARRLPVDLIKPWNRLHHLIDILHKKACLAMHHNLGSGPPGKRDDRTAQSHGFNHHHAKWLLPFNRIEEPTSTTE